MERAGMTEARRYVLIIDDHDDSRELLVEILREGGFHTVTAVSGPEGLERLRSAVTLPFLILTDVAMPDMDGATFRERQVADPRLANIPVVLVSAHHDLQRLGPKLGLDTLQKPIDLRRVLELVRRAARGTSPSAADR
ncbi:MAG: response regulator [Polyangiaceae bacterium]|nr:response regulator [Polyangiaceae bacterium]